MRGGDPSTMQKVYVPRDPHEKAMQRALIQYRDPKNYALVKEALLREGRSDLIGFGEKFLIPPREPRRATDSLSPRGISDSRKSQKSRGSQTAHDSRKLRGNSGKSGSSGRRSGPKKH
jgi:hypothetical protein